MVEKKKYLVIFDLDGTVVNFTLDWKSARKDVVDLLESRGIPGSLLDTKNSILELLDITRRHVEVNVKTSDIDLPGIKNEVLRIVDEYEKAAARTSRPIKNVRLVLEKLKERGYYLAICTLNTSETASMVLSKHDLLKFFDVIAGRDKVPGKLKPNPAHGAFILNELQVDVENACMIGDHPADMLMARDLGIGKIAILSERHGKDDFSEVKDIRFINYESYLAILDLVPLILKVF
ncbi:MAG: HAD family hydrolase [Promethearchaeota archaeon]